VLLAAVRVVDDARCSFFVRSWSGRGGVVRKQRRRDASDAHTMGRSVPKRFDTASLCASRSLSGARH
jgi:hypothetical protein